jgi:ATP-dependent RNA helicase DeaD
LPHPSRYNADALHGDLSQQQRDNVMARFRNRQIKMLVATDVAARGIDVNNITHVINYNLPDDIENYTHRSGRTARAGKSGISLIIMNTREVSRIREIERQIGKKFIQKPVPVGKDVCERQLMYLVDKVSDTEVDDSGINHFMPEVMAKLDHLSKEELIKKIVSTEFNRFLDYYRNAPDLNTVVKFGRDKGQASTGEQGFTQNNEVSGRFFLNLGEMDGFDEDTFREFVGSVTGIDPYEVKRIHLKDSFCFFEADKKHADRIMNEFSGKKFKGRKLRIDNAGASEGGRKGGYGGGGGGGRSNRNERSSFEGKGGKRDYSNRDSKKGKPSFSKERKRF